MICDGSRTADWRGRVPPRRVASSAEREQHLYRCGGPQFEGLRPNIVPLSTSQTRRAQRTPHLGGGMHILVPSSDVVGYDVLAEDMFDGLPPICCLEDLELSGGQADDGDEALRPSSDLPQLDGDVWNPIIQDGAVFRAGSPSVAKEVDMPAHSGCIQTPSKPPLLTTYGDQCPRSDATPERRTYLRTGSHTCKAEDCGRTFSRLSDCQRHESTHLKEKPFVCPGDGCGRKSYGRKDALLRHISAAHGEDNQRLRLIV